MNWYYNQDNETVIYLYLSCHDEFQQTPQEKVGNLENKDI